MRTLPASVLLSKGCVRKLIVHKSMKKPCLTGSGTGRVVKEGLGKGDTGTEIREECVSEWVRNV